MAWNLGPENRTKNFGVKEVAFKNTAKTNLKTYSFSTTNPFWCVAKNLQRFRAKQKGLPLHLERFLYPNSSEDQKKEGLHLTLGRLLRPNFLELQKKRTYSAYQLPMGREWGYF